MELGKKPKFLFYNKCEKIIKEEDKMKREKGNAIFISIKNTKVKLPYITIADSAYDQTFKLLFTGEKEINGVNGALRFDIACKCFCWEIEQDKNKKNKKETPAFCVDLEMQIKYESNFIDRFSKYKDSFRSMHEMPVVVLTFLNYKNGTDPFNNIIGKYANKKVRGIASFLVDDTNTPLEIIPEFHNNIYIFNLKNEIEDINKNKIIKLNNKKLNYTGMAWIKLLSLRHWAKEVEINNLKRYIIPAYILDLPSEIQSAISILEFINDKELKSFILYEKQSLEWYDNIMMEGEKKGEIKGEKKGMIKGEKIGEKKGMKKGSIRFQIGLAINMIKKNEAMDKINEFTKLSENEINIITNFINDPNYQISDLELNFNLDENDLVDICENNNLAGEERKIKKRDLNPDKNINLDENNLIEISENNNLAGEEREIKKRKKKYKKKKKIIK